VNSIFARKILQQPPKNWSSNLTKQHAVIEMKWFVYTADIRVSLIIVLPELLHTLISKKNPDFRHFVSLDGTNLHLFV